MRLIILHFFMALTLAGGSLATQAVADSRCPNTGKIAKIGMSMYEVKLTCGEPAFRAVGGNNLGTISSSTGTLGREVWTYDFGNSSFIQYFHFDGGALRSVTRSDQYGTSNQGSRKNE